MSAAFVSDDKERQHMKQGLCESVAPEKSSAGGVGSPNELNAEDAAEFLLDTSIDLGGSLCPQRLAADARQVTVSNLVGNRQAQPQRHWRWEHIEAFRVQPAVGSHFLQVQIDGQW